MWFTVVGIDVREPLGPQELGGLWFQLEQLPDGALGHVLASIMDLGAHHGEVDGPHRVLGSVRSPWGAHCE